MKYIIFFFLVVFTSCNRGKSDAKIKSITKTINDTLLEKRIFDKNQNIIFEKNNQIDFGNKNSIISISVFEYDTINNVKIEYYLNSNLGYTIKSDSTDLNKALRIESINTFDISDEGFYLINPNIKNKESFRNELLKINTLKDFNNSLKISFLRKFPNCYSYKHSDSIKTKTLSYVKKDTIIIETFKTQDDVIIENTKSYFGKNGKKLKEMKAERDNWTLFIYDKNEKLILEKENGQHYKYYYENNLLIKKEMYHDNILAFIEEYYHENGLIIKEIKFRKTKSIYFQEIPEKQIINYKYEYY